MTRNETYIGPVINIIGGAESRLSLIVTEILPVEKSSWGYLFSAFLELDAQMGRVGRNDAFVSDFRFTVDIDTMPDDLWQTDIRPLFIDPLTHMPQFIEVSLRQNGDMRMHGICEAIWEGTKPIPIRTQYHFANGNDQRDFCKLLKVAALRISGTEIPGGTRVN
jgi:hypothetical protein